MTADVLAGERLIAIALLRPGWEKNYEAAPAVHEVACVGRVAAAEPLRDGRYNILVQGEERVRIVDEVRDRPYRRAVVAGLAETYAGASRLGALRERIDGLLEAIREAAPDRVDPDAVERLRAIEPFGAMIDALVFHLPLDVAAKQAALSETDVAARAEAAAGHLEGILSILR